MDRSNPRPDGAVTGSARKAAVCTQTAARRAASLQFADNGSIQSTTPDDRIAYRPPGLESPDATTSGAPVDPRRLPGVSTPPRAAAIVLAGGSGSRVGAATNKVLLPLAGVPLLAHCVRTVLDVAGVSRLVVVVRPEERAQVAEALSPHLGAHDAWLVDGGAQRHDSEYAGIRALAGDVEAGEIDVVAIHDGARPLATAELWTRVITEAARTGAAIPVHPVGRLHRRDGRLAPPGLVGVQTPQAFRAVPLLAAHEQAAAEGWRGTDTAAVLERYTDLRVAAVPGGPANLKVTYPDDVRVAERLLTR